MLENVRVAFKRERQSDLELLLDLNFMIFVALISHDRFSLNSSLISKLALLAVLTKK